MKNLTNDDLEGEDVSPSFKELLNKEIYRRSITGTVAHFLFLCLVLVALKKFYLKTSYLPLPIFLLITGIAVRTLCLFSFKKNEKVRKTLFLFGTVVLGIAWGKLSLQIVSYYGVESIQTMTAIGFISTMVAIAVSTLSAFPLALVCFLITCTAYPSYMLFSQGEVLWNYLGLFFLINLLYQLFSGYRIYLSIVKQTKDLVKEVKERKRLQEIINAIPSLVLIINENKIYEMVNSFQNSFYQNLLLGQKVGFFPSSPIEKAFLNFFESDKDSENLEIQAFDFGPEEWCMVTMNKIKSNKSIICNVLPTTELVRTRNELEIQKARGEYSSKLIALGEMAANITHELGNPLTILKGSVKVLISELVDLKLSDIAQKNINVIDTTINRMGSIIRGLKSISQSQGLDFSNVRFKEVMEPVLEITASKMAEHGISFIVNGEDSTVELFCDEVQITQVILNLVDNAIDAVNKNETKWVKVSYRPGIEWCEIFVQDSGVIKDPEIIQKMMLPFFTTKNKLSGTGLGLSLSEKILKEHNGRLIFLKDEQHTTFLIKLPRMA